MALRMFIACLLCVGLVAPATADDWSDKHPQTFDVIRGFATGVQYVARDHDGDPADIVALLHVRVEHIYGAEVDRFSVHARRGSTIRLHTPWDAGPLRDGHDMPWCERIEAVLPPGIRMGERWIIVAGWRDQGGQAIVEVEPYTPEAERRMTTKYRDAILDREQRTAELPTHRAESHLRTTRQKLRSLQYQIWEAAGKGNDEHAAERIERFHDLQRHAVDDRERLTARATMWLAHLHRRLENLGPDDDEERRHVQNMIHVVTSELDDIDALREAIAEMKPQGYEPPFAPMTGDQDMVRPERLQATARER